MISYDSHNWLTFIRMRGSVFPNAVLYSMPSAIAAFCLKHFHIIDIDGDEFSRTGKGTVYSGFTFVLGFILVFRTSQSYARYWVAATAVHKMRSEWLDACASLIAFSHMCKQGVQEIEKFSNTMVRLFGVLHAMALEEIASLADENFPLLDIEGLNREDLRVLTTEAAQGRKVEIVIQWIKVMCLRSHEEGVLNVPAPILTRVFQELGNGLINYHEALQIVIWPFPFPYAQMSVVLVAIYMVITPLMITLWTESAWYCSVATLMSIVCMKGMDLISAELENPFGDDPNDLPCFQLHHTMNKDLVLLLNPQTWQIPRLVPSAKTDYRELAQENLENQVSLNQYYDSQEANSLSTTWRRVSEKFSCRCRCGKRLPSITAKFPVKRSKMQIQHEWAKQTWMLSKMRSCHMLGMEATGTESHPFTGKVHATESIPAPPEIRRRSLLQGLQASDGPYSKPCDVSEGSASETSPGGSATSPRLQPPQDDSAKQVMVAKQISASLYSEASKPGFDVNSFGEEAMFRGFTARLESCFQRQEALNERHLEALDRVLLSVGNAPGRGPSLLPLPGAPSVSNGDAAGTGGCFSPTPPLISRAEMDVIAKAPTPGPHA